jgi:DNA polymerase-1|tara:strand:+ start:1999 stop:3843 length:1845 start_codon:yes stop_codon:yes gene_type:complete
MKKYKILFFDIETNAIDFWPTLDGLKDLHCISIFDPGRAKMHSFSSNAGNLDEGVAMLNDSHNICGHNAINFDAPALGKLGYEVTPRVVDTKVMSQVIHPDLFTEDCRRGEEFPKQLRGRHSLKAWGLRLGNEKDDHGATEDWTKWSQEMQDYCEQDVHVVVDLFSHFMEGKPSSDMLYLEHDFANLMTLQEMNGWPFNIEKANALTEELMARRAELRDELQDMFPATTEEMKTPMGWTVEVDGKHHTAVTKVGLKGLLKEKGLKQVLADKAVKTGNKTKTSPFNPNSRDQIAERLMKMGWKPQAYEGKRPKIDEAVLKGIDKPEAQMLLEYLLISKRLGQVAEGRQAWLKLVRDGRIHGEVNTNGAISGRCTHSKPNVSQVPASRATYGDQCRELFHAPEGKVLVGADASGLELRCLAAFLYPYDNGEYARTIVEGDIHTANQQAAGLPTRDHAKTFIYAFLYGSGDQNLGKLVGGSRKEGKRLKEEFMRKIPAIKKLKNAIEQSLKGKQWLGGLDGRRLPVRSAHSALNLLLQSSGAVIMKKALIIFCKEATHPFELHGNIHDEVQFSCLEEHAKELGQLFCDSLAKAGKQLKFRCPLDGEYSIGKTWKDTH